jgi:ATP-binding cassette subfamily C protein
MQTIRQLREIFGRRDKWLACVLLLIMIGGAGVEVLGVGMIPVFVSTATDAENVLSHPWAAPVLEPLGITTARELLIGSSIGLLLLFFFKNAYICFQQYAVIRFTQNRRVELMRRMFNAYMHAPYEFHLRRNSAELLRNTQQEAARVIGQVIGPALRLLMRGLMMGAIVGLLFFTNPVAAAVGVGILALAGGGFYAAIQNRMKRYGQQAQAARKTMVQSIQQGLGAIKEARVGRSEPFFVDTLLGNVRRWIRAERFRQLTTQVTMPYMELVAVSALLAIALTLLLSGQGAREVAPTLAMFGYAFVRLKAGVGQVVKSFSGLRYGVVSVEPVYRDMKRLGALSPRRPQRHRWGEASESVTLREEIRLEDVWYRYPGAERYALRGVSLTIPRGSSVGFVGPTGAGKTTLIDVLLGLLEPESGRVTVDGADIRGALPQWRRDIGYIPQAIYLTDDTIKRNIAFGVPEKRIDEDRLRAAIRDAQLESFIDELPEGLETTVGEGGVRLSGGQRQRIAIARALYHDPDVLVMDEATAALDNATERALMQSIERLRGERTLLMIAHRLTTLRGCDRLYYLEDGQIEAAGSYDELQQRHASFRAMAG